MLVKSDFISKLAMKNEASNFKNFFLKEKRAFIDIGLSSKSKVKNKDRNTFPEKILYLMSHKAQSWDTFFLTFSCVIINY